MGTQPRRSLAAVVLTLIVLAADPPCSVGQSREGQSLGSVLNKTGNAQLQRKDRPGWQPLTVDGPIFNQDRVSTGPASTADIERKRCGPLSIAALTRAYFYWRELSMCEEPEAQTQPCPTQLEKGTALLHAMAPQEVHTPNAVICVQGTTVLIRFTTPPDTTEVISLMGTVTVWNQQGVRAKVTLAANSRALVIGNRQPVKTPDFPFPRPPVKVAPDPGVGCNPQTCGPTVDHPLRNTALEAIIHIPR